MLHGAVQPGDIVPPEHRHSPEFTIRKRKTKKRRSLVRILKFDAGQPEVRRNEIEKHGLNRAERRTLCGAYLDPDLIELGSIRE